MSDKWVYCLGLKPSAPTVTSFVDKLIDENVVKGVVDCIKNNADTTSPLVVWGKDGSGLFMVEALRKAGLGDRISGYLDKSSSENMYLPFKDIGDWKTVLDCQNGFLLVCLPNNVREELRNWIYRLKQTRCNVILPLAPEGRYQLECLENPKPFVFLCPPHTGTNRFWPTMNSLLSKFVRPHAYGRFSLIANSRFAQSCKNEKPVTAEMRGKIDSHFKSMIRNLDYFEHLMIHEQISLPVLAEAHDVQSVVLMRDPRDQMVSYYAMYLTRRGYKSDVLLELMDGGSFIQYANYRYICYPIYNLVSDLVAAMDTPNVRIVRFEDLHRDSLNTFKSLIAWLGYDKDYSVRLTDEEINEAVHLGSFEYQTEGRFKRGQSDKVILGTPGVGCRKGVVGDWVNYFTPVMKDKFKRLTGDGLIKLGYEKDMDW